VTRYSNVRPPIYPCSVFDAELFISYKFLFFILTNVTILFSMGYEKVTARKCNSG